MISVRLIALARITRDLIDRKRTVKPIIAVLNARKRTIGPIIRDRGVRLLSTLLRITRRRRIQPHLRIRLPNMQPHSTMHMNLHALSRLKMNIMKSRLTKTTVRGNTTPV